MGIKLCISGCFYPISLIGNDIDVAGWLIEQQSKSSIPKGKRNIKRKSNTRPSRRQRVKASRHSKNKG